MNNSSSGLRFLNDVPDDQGGPTMPTDRSEQSRPDAIDFIADGDPFDHFPWTVTLYSEEFH